MSGERKLLFFRETENNEQMSIERGSEAAREIADTLMLVAYLLEQNLDFTNLENFTDDTVERAREYYGRVSVRS